MKTNLGKLKKIDLRKAWPHEANDFTNWLAEDENLSDLSKTIGMDLSLIQTEASVGKFNVDILAEESITEKKVIIENQLEVTNHAHLGQLITYAAGFDAKAAIWLVKDVRDEHKKSIEWLNNISDEEIGFFLIKIELLQIGDSNLAPRFEVISSPNEWAKDLKSRKANQQISDLQLSYLNVWENFRNFVEPKDASVSSQTAQPHHWYNVAVGMTGVHIALNISSQNNTIDCGLWIKKDKLELYNYLLTCREEIEKKVGIHFEWREAPGGTSRIFIKKEKIKKIQDIGNQKDVFKWFFDNIQLFKASFRPYMTKFRNSTK